jgi:CRP-like cAMP-binding protein
MPSNTLIVS